MDIHKQSSGHQINGSVQVYFKPPTHIFFKVNLYSRDTSTILS